MLLRKIIIFTFFLPIFAMGQEGGDPTTFDLSKSLKVPALDLSRLSLSGDESPLSESPSFDTYSSWDTDRESLGMFQTFRSTNSLLALFRTSRASFSGLNTSRSSFSPRTARTDRNRPSSAVTTAESIDDMHYITDDMRDIIGWDEVNRRPIFANYDKLSNNPYNIGIVGGGLLGCTTALLLEQIIGHAKNSHPKDRQGNAINFPEISITMFEKNAEIINGSASECAAILHAGGREYHDWQTALHCQICGEIFIKMMPDVYGKPQDMCEKSDDNGITFITNPDLYSADREKAEALGVNTHKSAKRVREQEFSVREIMECSPKLLNTDHESESTFQDDGCESKKRRMITEPVADSATGDGMNLQDLSLSLDEVNRMNENDSPLSFYSLSPIGVKNTASFGEKSMQVHSLRDRPMNIFKRNAYFKKSVYRIAKSIKVKKHTVVKKINKKSDGKYRVEYSRSPWHSKKRSYDQVIVAAWAGTNDLLPDLPINLMQADRLFAVCDITHVKTAHKNRFMILQKGMMFMPVSDKIALVYGCGEGASYPKDADGQIPDADVLRHGGSILNILNGLWKDGEHPYKKVTLIGVRKEKIVMPAGTTLEQRRYQEPIETKDGITVAVPYKATYIPLLAIQILEKVVGKLCNSYSEIFEHYRLRIAAYLDGKGKKNKVPDLPSWLVMPFGTIVTPADEREEEKLFMQGCTPVRHKIVDSITPLLNPVHFLRSLSHR